MIIVEQEILWLQISVYNVKLVNIFNSTDELMIQFTCLFLFKLLISDDIIE